MDIRRLKIENCLFILALLLGIGIRLYNLGAAPLSDAEADWALQALQVAQPAASGEPATFGPQPAYIFLTGLTFSIFGSNNFLARLWPALAGWSLIWLPWMFRGKLGRKTALILAFGLALDPGLVVSARMAGGPAMAYGFGLLALGLFFTNIPVLAGVFAGLALLSGPAVINGGLGLIITAVFARFLPQTKTPENPAQPAAGNLRPALLGGGLTILVMGTLFSRFPQGLSAWFGALPGYLQGWFQPSDVPLIRLVIALLFFGSFALFFAALGLLRWLVNSVRSPFPIPYRQTLALVWALVSLLMALIYPGRQTTDLVWTLVPLWIMAASDLSDYLPDKKPHPLSFIQAFLIFLFAVLFWTTLVATSRATPVEGIPWNLVRFAILVGILALGILTSAMVALGWNWQISRNGSAWGLSAILLVHSTAALWGASQLRTNYPQELWAAPPATGQAGLLEQTLKDLSEWDTGMAEHIEVVSTVGTPSIRWLLRDFTDVRYLAQPPTGEMPALVITPLTDETPSLAASYRGQDFVWWIWQGWSGVLPVDTISWLAYRQAPVVNEYIILWARSDIFPGGRIELEPLIEDLEE